MASRKTTDWIAVHCSATRPSMDVGVKEIDKWHKARGWSGVGYHYVVRRNGTVEAGRPEKAIGAHVEGYNHNSLGICWVGGVNDDTLGPEDNRTPEQKAALKTLIAYLKTRYPNAKVQGHRDFPSVKKACPSYDARAEYADL